MLPSPVFHGVVRRVPLPIPGAQIVGFERVQVGHIADDRGLVERLAPHFHIERFPHFARRAVVGAHPPLLADHVHLVGKIAVAEIEAAHAVSLHAHSLDRKSVV